MEENYEYTEPCLCGHHACEGVKSWDVDPFAEEIHDDHSLYFDCEGGRYESAMDI